MPLISAPWLMVIASFLFASMAVCVTLAPVRDGAAEIVFYRGLTGAMLMLMLMLMLALERRSGSRTLVNASLQTLGIAYSFVYGLLLFDERITPAALAGRVLVVGAGMAVRR